MFFPANPYDIDGYNKTLEKNKKDNKISGNTRQNKNRKNYNKKNSSLIQQESIERKIDDIVTIIGNIDNIMSNMIDNMN